MVNLSCPNLVVSTLNSFYFSFSIYICVSVCLSIYPPTYLPMYLQLKYHQFLLGLHYPPDTVLRVGTGVAVLVNLAFHRMLLTGLSFLLAILCCWTTGDKERCVNDVRIQGEACGHL